MHITDGLLPPPVWLGGYGITGLTTWFSLVKLHQATDPTRGIPKASLLTAAFFVASSLFIPIPPIGSVHLLLNGLLGVVLGYYAFPAILVGLFLQAVMFGHGGLSTLGINAVIMGIPALIASYLFQLRTRLTALGLKPQSALATSAFLGGSLGVGLAVGLFYGLVLFTIPAGLEGDTERTALATLVLLHSPLIVLEGLFTMMIVLFLHRVKPELLADL